MCAKARAPRADRAPKAERAPKPRPVRKERARKPQPVNAWRPKQITPEVRAQVVAAFERGESIRSVWRTTLIDRGKLAVIRKEMFADAA